MREHHRGGKTKNTSVAQYSFANLNPFLEFNGYYVLGDLTGIPSLRRRSFEYSRYWLVRRARRTPLLPTADIWPGGGRRIGAGAPIQPAVYPGLDPALAGAKKAR